MKQVAAGFMMFLLVSCGTASDSSPRPTGTPAEDLQWLDTLREIDERSSALVATAKFDATRQELRTFADVVGHAHRKRTEAMDRWRDRVFDAAPKQVALPTCATQWRTVTPRSRDSVLISALIEQRGCMLEYAEEARANVQSAEVAQMVTETIRTVSGELQQLRTWSVAWTE